MHLKTKMATLVTLVLMLTSIISMSTTAANAQVAATKPVAGPLQSGITPNLALDTIAYLSFTPNPIGLGQTLLVNLWLQPTLPASRYFPSLTVTITKPDGTKDVIGPMDSYQGDTSAWFQYSPDQIGTWKLKFDFPGAYYPAGPYLEYRGTYISGSLREANVVNFTQSAYYNPSSMEKELVVQNDFVASWPPSPLPTDYWTRPISPENREWWIIGGNYPFNGLGGGEGWPANTNTYAANYRFTPYVQAPNTAHILWKRQGEFGGLLGGQFGKDSFYMGGGFGDTSNAPNIVFQGRCYQTITRAINGVATSIWQCYDLRTGEVYWEQAGLVAPTFITLESTYGEVPGAMPDWRNSMLLGAISNGMLIKYNPYTGAVIQNVSISPLTSGTVYCDPFVLSVQTIGSGANTRYRLINWTMSGSNTNFTTRILNNVSWPFSSLGTVDYETGVAVTTMSVVPPATAVANNVMVQGASLITGQLLWNVSAGAGPIFSGSTGVADHGKYAVRFDDGFWRCWELSSGKFLWKSDLSSYPWGSFGAYTTASAYGYIYSNAYDGISAIDWNTGKIAWTFVAPTPYAFETPYEGKYAWFTSTGVRIADGKLYAYNNEHTMSQPISRGLRLFCMNATTGQNIWNITGYLAPGAVADGYYVAGNMYDGYMYVVGKGKSATSVTAPDLVIAKGNGVVIEGRVLDQSPGQPDTPCVSAESMTTQMEYLHMQHPIDGLAHNVTMTGVPVSLTAIDSNNNYIDIGTVTTSAYYGTYEMAWTPPAEGTYKIIANFAGDDSYGSSAASTAISVGPAPATIDNNQQLTLPDYSMTIIGVGIAVIIAVAIATILLYRKK